jgi:hypothetical protein
MQRIALVVVAWFGLCAIAIPTDAAPRPARPSAARSDGVWYKGDGRLGYGWYSIYGDFVGTDGYTYIARRPRSPGNPFGLYIGPGSYNNTYPYRERP